MHNLQVNSTDLLRLITSATCDLDCAVSYIEATQASPPVPDWPQTQFTNITTATTTTILGAPTSGTDIRKIKAVSIVNVHASAAVTIRVVIERSGPVTWDIFNTIVLQPGESLTFTENLGWIHNKAEISVPVGSTNLLLGADQALGAADVYLNNSVLKLDGLGPPLIGRTYHWRMIIVKTAVGTATPILNVRVGTAGAVGDTARVTFTWGAGTANIDRGEMEVDVAFIAVGASAILRAKANWTTNTEAVGLSANVKALQPADSATFDSTIANSLIGLSYNAGTSGAHTLEFMKAYTDQL